MSDKTQTIVTLVAMLAVVGIMLFCPDAKSQPLTIEFKLLSPGHSLTLNDGIKVRYYKLNEYLELYTFDKELVKLRADVQDLGDLNNKLKIQMDVLETRIIPTLENDKEVLRKRSLRLEEKWEKAEQARVDEAGGSVWPYVVGISGALVGIIGISVGAGIALSNASP